MGDMADYAVDSLECADGYFSRLEPPKSKECKFCGKLGLHWNKSDDGWRLVDAVGRVHSCKEFNDAHHAERRRSQTPSSQAGSF